MIDSYVKALEKFKYAVYIEMIYFAKDRRLGWSGFSDCIYNENSTMGINLFVMGLCLFMTVWNILFIIFVIVLRISQKVKSYIIWNNFDSCLYTILWYGLSKWLARNESFVCMS